MSVESRIVLFALLALFGTKCNGQETELELKLEGEQTLSEGDGTTIVCTITNNVPGGFLRWVKVYKNEDDTETEVAIGTNGQIENEYKTLLGESGERRYEASMDQVSGTNTFIAKLIFSEMKVEDGGQYQCKLPSVNDLVQSVDISVTTPPSSLQFGVTHSGNEVTFEEGGVVEFEQGDIMSLSCSATGGHPAAQVNITVGNIDITENFERQEVPNTEYLSPRGLVKTTYDVKLTLKEAITIDYEHASQKVSCKAGIPGGEATESASFRIKMPGFPPVFNCDDQRLVTSYTKNFEFQCRVKAEPRIHDAYYYFYKKGSEDKTIIKPDTIYGEYEMKALEFDEETQEDILTLYFPRVFRNMIRNYTFVAINDVDEVEYQLTLAIDEENEKNFNSAYSIASSVVSVIVAGLLCLLQL